MENSFGLSDEKMKTLQSSIASAFNSVSFENLSNTPDFILAEVAINAAIEFSKMTNKREAFYTNDPSD